LDRDAAMAEDQFMRRGGRSSELEDGVELHEQILGLA